MTKRISVITPCYNSLFLLETIDSVLAQDYPDIEYIIIDDGSEHFDSEEIAQYIRSKSDVSLKIMKHESNKGTVRTLNDAIDECTGKYIFELAADDWFYSPDVLRLLVEEFEKTQSMVITGKRMLCEKETMRELYPQPSKKIAEILMSGDNKTIFDKMCFSNIIIGCCTAYSKECIEKYGKYDEQYRLIEDYPRYLKLVRENVKIHYIDRILVRYRMGGVSSDNQYNQTYEDENDMVVRNEVLPYSENPEHILKYYEKWKKRRFIGSEFTHAIDCKKGLSKIGCLFRYSFKSPYVVASYLKRQMCKKRICFSHS